MLSIDRDDDSDSTRKIVLSLRKEATRREGASTVWRLLGGAAATVALAIAGYAVALAQQAAVDHEVVVRHERTLDGQGEQLAQIREEQAAQTALLQRFVQQWDEERGRR